MFWRLYWCSWVVLSLRADDNIRGSQLFWSSLLSLNYLCLWGWKSQTCDLGHLERSYWGSNLDVGLYTVKILPPPSRRYSKVTDTFNSRSKKESLRLQSNYSLFLILLYFWSLNTLKLCSFHLEGIFQSRLGAYQNFLSVLAPIQFCRIILMEELFPN